MYRTTIKTMNYAEHGMVILLDEKDLGKEEKFQQIILDKVGLGAGGLWKDFKAKAFGNPFGVHWQAPRGLGTHRRLEPGLM